MPTIVKQKKKIFFSNIKIYKDSSAKYYQKTKKSIKENILVKGIKIFPKKKKKKKQEYGRKLYKNVPGSEKQSFVEYRKNYSNSGKTLHVNWDI